MTHMTITYRIIQVYTNNYNLKLCSEIQTDAKFFAFQLVSFNCTQSVCRDLIMMIGYELPYLWTARIVYVAAIIITTTMLAREIQARNKDRKNESHILRNKMLDLWSFLTLLSSVIVPFLHLSRQIPVLCEYTFSLSYSTMGIQKVLFTYYQIARLKYCFSSDSIHSTKYGYPSCLFTYLYSMGIILSIGYVISFFLILEPKENDANNGCFIGVSPVWSVDTLIFVINYACYFLWDWLVLFLYIYKIYQLKKHQKRNSKTFSPQVNNRILFILSKIVFLTVIYEILAV